VLQERFGDEKIYKNASMYGTLQKEYEEKRNWLDLLYRGYELRIR
jgi:hypothetical protein